MANMAKPLPTIGVDKYTYCPMAIDATSGKEMDTEAGIKYGTAVTLPGTVEITPNDAFDAENFDADNIAYIVDTYIDTMGHDITNADIPPETDAAWRGLTKDENGAFIMVGQPKTVYFAAMWRVLKSNGKHRYVKYFKGSYTFASNVGGSTKPSTGASEKQTAQATYNAVQTAYKGANGEYAFMYIDEEDIPIGSETGSYATIAAFETAWFSDPLAMSGIPEITP